MITSIEQVQVYAKYSNVLTFNMVHNYTYNVILFLTIFWESLNMQIKLFN